MLYLALSIGLYSYIIFFMGILGFLYKNLIVLISVFFWTTVLIYFFKKSSLSLKFNTTKWSSLSILFLGLLIAQSFINLVGTIGPEIGFDALWYHLTIPKIFLENHKIFHIPGGLLYYSDMPKLTEMLYLASFSIVDELGPKIIHFLFGIGSLFIIYKTARKFVSLEFSLLSAVIFYSNLVVGWLSISAYIDLARTFFEILSFYLFLKWVEKKDRKYLIYSSLMLGFAISVKLVAVFDILIFLVLFLLYFKKYLKEFFYFTLISLIVTFPWLIFSFINTGNPFYPFLSLPVDSEKIFSFPNIFKIINPADPISPLYLIVIPLIIINYKIINKKTKMLIIYSITAFLIWLLFLSERGTRFLFPYLGMFSVVCAYIIYKLENVNIKKYLIFLAVIISLVSIGYRMFANTKFIPYLTGGETKAEFLAKNLNFSFGDFYDIDGYFKKNITTSDKVLLYGFHNLYFVDFPYIDSSWVKKGDKFNYIVVQEGKIPQRFSDWKVIYYNEISRVKLYTKERKTWVY